MNHTSAATPSRHTSTATPSGPQSNQAQTQTSSTQPSFPNEVLDVILKGYHLFGSEFGTYHTKYSQSGFVPRGFMEIARGNASKVIEQLEWALKYKRPVRAVSFKSMPSLPHLESIVAGLISLCENNVPSVNEVIFSEQALNYNAQRNIDDTVYQREENGSWTLMSLPGEDDEDENLLWNACNEAAALLAELCQSCQISRITMQISEKTADMQDILRWALFSNKGPQHQFKKQTIFLPGDLKEIPQPPGSNAHSNYHTYQSTFPRLLPLPSEETYVISSFPKQMCQLRYPVRSKIHHGTLHVLVNSYGEQHTKESLTKAIRDHLNRFPDDAPPPKDVTVDLTEMTYNSDISEAAKALIEKGNREARENRFTEGRYIPKKFTEQFTEEPTGST